MNARNRIGDAAEQVFATHGFEGASMRLIAERADVAQALLHYHFQNKETLYAAVFERRSSTVNEHRTRMLDELFAANRKPTLEAILDILFLPAATLSEIHGGDYESYQQMVSAVSISNDARAQDLVKLYFDPIARRFIDAFRRVVPSLSERAAIWSYLFVLGARMQAQSRSNRAARLAKSKSMAGSPAALLTAFAAAGIRALATERGSQSDRGAARASSKVIRRVKRPSLGQP